MLTLEVDSNQRIGNIGRTRMGKTFLVEHLCEQQPRVIVVDSKWRCDWSGYSLTYSPDAAMLSDHVIYRPADEGKPPESFWRDAMMSLHEHGGGVLYVDELPVITTPNRIAQTLADIFRMGGELGVGVWWSAQEATTIANTAIRQSDIITLFRNHGASDRDKLGKIVGDIAEVTAHLTKYEFVVYESSGVEYDPGNIPIYKVIPSGR